MIKNIMINASKTAPAPIVYYNELWTMGSGLGGANGDNTTITRSSPVQIGTLSNWVSASAGLSAGNAINTSGSLWVWGNNSLGALGLGDTINRSSPVQVGTLNNWSSVTEGSHTMAIKTDGTLWAWGTNTSGQLGDGTTVNKSSPVQIGTLTNWRSVETGRTTTAAIKTDGTLWTWGSQTNGTTGLATPNDNITFSPIFGSSTFKEVSVGYVSYTMAINSDGSLWGWGNNGSYYLGDGTITNRIEPTKNTAYTATDWKQLSSNSHTMGIKTDGTLWGWGVGTTGRIGNDSTSGDISPQQIGPDTDWKDVAAGSINTVAIKTGGTLWTWGGNSSGQLGLLLATSTQRSSPVQVGTLTNWSTCAANGGTINSFCAAIKTDGTLWGWGFNGSGQLGIGVNGNRSSPVQVGTLGTWKNVAVGDTHTMAIKTDGTLWGWGFNPVGQIGEGSISRSSPVQVGTLATWSSVSAGSSHTIAIKTDGTAWVWGLNNFGQLGIGDTTNRSSPVQIGSLTNWVSGSSVSTVSALLNTDGIVYTAGNNGNVTTNALGRYTQSTFNRSSPAQVGALTNWSSISLKDNHCLAITTGGSLYSWGQNSDGQLGSFGSNGRSSPVQVGTLTNWSTVRAGYYHNVATKTDGTLWTWGSNSLGGELGLGDKISRSSPVQVGTLATWSKVDAGEYYTMAIKTDGTLWSWGYNDQGSLGDNTTFSKSSPIQIGASTRWHSVSIRAARSILIKRYL